jgi:hypothetical protein
MALVILVVESGENLLLTMDILSDERMLPHGAHVPAIIVTAT